MPSPTVWYIPGSPAGFWLVRSERGRLWAFPNVARAWERGLRFRVEFEPTVSPLGPESARVVADLLGLPGAEPTTERDRCLAVAEQIAEERYLSQVEVAS
jgi:hypothetical protein